LEIALKNELFDPEGDRLCRRAREYFGIEYTSARVSGVITFDVTISRKELERSCTHIFVNPVTQTYAFGPLSIPFDWVIWVSYKPGVKDTAGEIAIEAISDFLTLSPGDVGKAYTSKLYYLQGTSLRREDVEKTAGELLANDLIQQWRVFDSKRWDSRNGIGLSVPDVQLARSPEVRQISVTGASELYSLSRKRGLALNRLDVPVIIDYFSRKDVSERRKKWGLTSMTDIELETIAQSRSDHCNHNTFKGYFSCRDTGTGETFEIDNLFRTCIEEPTLLLKEKKPWIVSVLWDNAGVGRFDEKHFYTITGETHNSPSNMEAYGGAITGIVGIYRDPLGTGKGSKLILGTYGYCVGPRDYRGDLKPHLHPRRLLDGVIEGVRDGGNKSGVPTPLGFLYFHPSYLGKCLVFVGAMGIMPSEVGGVPSDRKRPHPGDCIVMCGGRVGKDGIHGVTAASEEYGAHTPAGHVQIGDPYTQKKMHDFLLEARDMNLIEFITDNGGGGLSSSVGESARFSNGCVVDLKKVPLKYDGLDLWEIWISESQERMTVAIKPDTLDLFMELSRKHHVESTVIGTYSGDGSIHLKYGDRTCGLLDIEFFRSEFPQWRFDAEWIPPAQRGLMEPVFSEPSDHGRVLRDLLARENMCSREWIVRQYDHEVQGGSVVKPLVGRGHDVPADAIVVRPLLDSMKGIAVAQAIHPAYGMIDTGSMTGCTIDEAVRRIVAVGGDPEHIGGVDNFCWPNIQYDPERNPDGKYKAAQLVRSCLALKDHCLAYGVPLLSGKDSMYIDGDLPGRYGERRKISGIPAFLFTATGVIDDVRKCVTMDVKMPGDLLYILGTTKDELGGSEYYELLEYTGRNVPVARPEQYLSYYRKLSEAIDTGLIASVHGVYRGGICVHLALAAMGGELGLDVDLDRIPGQGIERIDHLLYSESCGRFILTVSPRNRARFESLLDGAPVSLIGSVCEEAHLRLHRSGGNPLVDLDVSALKECWKRPFAGLI
jgi:phosphoribosylformylglycinamidine synthase